MKVWPKLTKVSFAGFDMKYLKVDEYIKRTASVEETGLLYEELKVSTNMFNSIVLLASSSAD